MESRCGLHVVVRPKGRNVDRYHNGRERLEVLHDFFFRFAKCDGDFVGGTSNAIDRLTWLRGSSSAQAPTAGTEGAADELGIVSPKYAGRDRRPRLRGRLDISFLLY